MPMRTSMDLHDGWSLILTIYSLVLLATFGTLLPYILDLKIQNPARYGDFPVVIALPSQSVQFSFVMSIGMAIPILLENIMYSLTHNFHQSCAVVILWILITSLTIPLITSFALTSNSSQYYELVIAILNCRKMLVIGSSAALLSVYGPHVWRFRIVVPSLALCLLYLLLGQLAPYLPEDSLKSVNITLWAIFSTSIATVSYMGVKWCIYIVVASKRFSTKLSEHDFCCTAHFVALAVLIVSELINMVSRRIILWTDFDDSYVTASVSIFTVYTVIVSIVNRHQVIREFHIDKADHEGRLKQMIVGYFSHEVRTPLNAVSMGLHIIRGEVARLLTSDEGEGGSGAGAEKCMQTVRDVEGSCAAIVDVLNDLVAYEQLNSDSAAMELDMRAIRVRPLLDRKFSLFRDYAAERGITLTALFGMRCLDFPSIMGDEAKIHQVLRNVLSNAVASAGDGGRVEVEVDVLLRGSAGGGQVGLSASANNPLLSVKVKDSGPAVANAHSLFEGDKIDFTAGIVEAGKPGALGLLIAHRLLELHRGSISYSQGEGGEGNVFTVLLPLQVQSSRSNSVLSMIAEEPERGAFSDELSSAEISFRPRSQPRPRSSRLGSLPRIFRSQSPRIVVDPTSAASASLSLEGRPVHMSEGRRGSGGMSTLLPDVSSAPVSAVADETVSPSRLPTAPHELQEESSSRAAAEEDVSIGLRLRLSRVLVVDDAVSNRKMLCRLLEPHSETTVTANNGQQAVRLMQDAIHRQSPFDLVLMDYQMPVMDGPSAAKAMREMGYGGPIIGVTGNVLPVHVNTFIAHGANSVLSKPLNLEALKQAIRDIATAAVGDADADGDGEPVSVPVRLSM